ncbi:MAG TPA: tetratricopeptide repeat protein, partial [Opitutus sp.]|nr:tetratricopeptide repeat protein [Opitutus sp.]
MASRCTSAGTVDGGGRGDGAVQTWYEQVYANARGASFDLSVLERCLIAGRAIVFYARTLVWPSDLMFINPRWSVNANEAWQYGFPGLVIGVGALLAWIARRRRGPLAVFLIYTGSLFPTLGFLNINWFNYSFVADHFQYVASLGLIVPVANLATQIAQRRKQATARIAATLTGSLLVAVLALLSWRQSGHYRDSETFYRQALAQNPASWIAHHNLGATLLDRPDRLDEAISHLATVLTLKPNHLRAHINLGHAFSRIPGRVPEAIKAFEGALRLDPKNYRVLTHLAQTFAQMPDGMTEAIATYRRALEVNPRGWEAHAGLAHLLAATPDTRAEAFAMFSAAIELQPADAALRNDFGGYLASLGRGQEAIGAFEAAVRIQPAYAEAHYNLGTLLADTPGRLDEAI